MTLIIIIIIIFSNGSELFNDAVTVEEHVFES
jgi:hypothetical protein